MTNSSFFLVLDVDLEKASLENMPANLYESVCVPDLGDFLGYQNANASTPDHKSPATPASSTTSNSSGPSNPIQAIPQGNVASQPTVPLQPRQYHNDGKYNWRLKNIFQNQISSR